MYTENEYFLSKWVSQYTLRFAGFGQVAHRLRATTAVSLHHHAAVGNGHRGTTTDRVVF